MSLQSGGLGKNLGYFDQKLHFVKLQVPALKTEEDPSLGLVGDGVAVLVGAGRGAGRWCLVSVTNLGFPLAHVPFLT